MDIRFYSGDGKLSFVLADYIRVKWKECLKDEGEAVITVLKSHPVASLVYNTPVLIAKYGENQGIVTGYRFQGEYFYVSVKPLLTLLKRRLVMGNFGEEALFFSGNPLEIIRDKILPFAEYIGFKGELRECTAREFITECGTDLLTAIKQMLSGTRIGAKIEFEPKTASFLFSFVYPIEYPVRLSNGNRNLASVSSEIDFTAVKNAGFFTERFFEPIDWNPWTNPYLITDYDTNNYLKQYKITGNAKWGELEFVVGQYAYCDTKDGKIKVSDQPKTLLTAYCSNEENPVCIFQQDLRKYNEQEGMSLIEIRQYVAERWSAEPLLEEQLRLGTIVKVEKDTGTEKGLKALQVVSVETDTEKPLPDIELA